MNIYSEINKTIGETPLVRLNTMNKGLNAEILAKLEYFNPLGSVKDRIAASMIDDAEANGLIGPDTLIVEPTSGNTGIALAFISASKGYRLCLTMPDTKDNMDAFGKPKGGRGEGGFPQMRVVALLVLPLRLVADFAYDAYKGKGTGERSLMATIIERIPYRNMLFLWDAGLYSFDLLQLALLGGNQVLAKLSASVKPKPIPGKKFADGGYLAVISKRIIDPERSDEENKCYKHIEIVVRIITYQIPGFRPARLITTILDPEISAMELAIHYHKRWDIEIAFDEIKTHQCATLRGQAPTVLRSKNPELVKQELHAIFIAYNLIRDLIHQSADQSKKESRSMSFLDSLQCVIDAIPNMCIFVGKQAKIRLQYLRSLIIDCTIDRPKRNRINPRVIKVKMSKFKRKKRFHKSTSRDLENELLVLGEVAA